MPAITIGELLSQQQGMYGSNDPAEVRNTFGWTDRLGAAVDRFQGQIQSVGEVLGLDVADARRQNEFESSYARQRAIQDTGAPASLSDINGVSSLGKGVLGLAVDSAPELGLSLATGGAAGLAGVGAVGRSALAAAAQYPGAVGDILSNQREEAGRYNPGAAFALGVPYAAVDALGLEGSLARGRMLRAGITSLDEAQGFMGGLKRTGANVALNAPVEGATETFQEFMNQAGRVSVNPEQTMFNPEANDRYLESFAGGALLGGAASAALGGWRRSEGYQPAPLPVEDNTNLGLRTDLLAAIRENPDVPLQDWINQQAGVSAPLAGNQLKSREADILAAFNEPSGVRVAGPDGQERELSAIEAMLVQQGLPPTQTPALQNSVGAPATPSKVWSADEQELITMGIVPNGKALELLTEIKASGLPIESLTPVITAMTERKNAQAKKLLAQAIIESKKAPAAAAPAAPPAAPPAVLPVAAAATDSPPAAIAPTVAPASSGGLRVVKGTAPATTPTLSPPVQENPTNVQAPQAVQAETQGKAPLAAAPAQGATPAAATAPAEPVVQRKRRVANPAALQQAQAFVAPEAVAEEGAAADPTDETDWEDSKPDGAPALSALTPSLRQVWSEARAAKAQGRRINLFKVAEDIVAEQGDEVADDDTLTTLNQIFGERDAAMLYDRYVDNMTEEVIANKYGLSRQAVAKVTGEGELGQKTRATKIKNAQKKYGWTDEYVQQLAARLTSAQSETEADSASGRTGVDLEASESGFGANTAEDAAQQDPSLREAGFSTSASLGGSVSNWRDSGELAGRDNITKADQAKLDALYARRAAAEEAGNDSEVEAADAEISMVETKYLTPGEVAAKFTQLWSDLADKVAKRTQQVEQALAAGKTAVSINNKLVPVDQVLAEIAELEKKAQDAWAKAEEVLQRGKVRKAKGVEPAKADVPKVRRVKKADAAAPAAPAVTTAPTEVLTPAEAAAKAWNQAANTIPGAPKWADLPPAQQREFVGYGENNWTRQDVVAMMQRGASDAKFGKDSKTKGKGTYTAAELADEIKAFIRADVLGRKLVIVDTIGDLLNSSDRTRKIVGAEMALNSAYGVAANGVGYLVADRIRKGSGRAKFMHEVGVHLGLESLLPKAVYDKLTQQIVNWAKADDGSLESEIALDATERVMEAGTKKEDRRAEMLAYFVEVAMERGIDPTAEVMQGSKGLREWFRTLWAAFKVAVRRLGMKPESLAAQDVVNLAFGAARLEIAGTWHGTAAAFRRFDHKFMNTGEGAQAYGWGTYLAQRFGIARGYWVDDVRRKTPDGTANLVKYQGWEVTRDINDPVTGDTLIFAGAVVNKTFKSDIKYFVREFGVDSISLRDPQTGKTEEVSVVDGARPDGSLMRVDVAVADDEFLDWDKPLTEQSAKVRSALQKAGRTYGSNDASASGRNLYEDLTAEFGDDAEAVSKYLDSIGVKGVKFLDARSRGTATNAVRFGGQEYNRDELRDELRAANQAKDWDRVATLAVLSYVLSDGVDFTLSDLEDRIRDLESQFLDNSKNSAERFGVQWNEAEARQKATADALATPQGKRLSWLRQNKDDIELVTQPKTRNLVIFNDKNIFRVGTQVAADKDRMRFGKDLREKLPAELQKPVGTIANVLSDTKNLALNALTFTEDVINRAVNLGIASAAKLRSIYQERAALTGRLEREVERVADLYNKVPQAERGTGPRSVNQFLYDSTREGAWGFKPSWRSGTSANVKVDSAMQQRFNALSKESKALVEAVFRHGDEVLSLKKQTVIDATNSEYDALIAAAKKANDVKKTARLTSDKADQLKRFNSLFALQEFRPYAPLKRFGDFVVIARSQKYLNADEKTRAKLEGSADDYHVSFAESASAAREMVAQLSKQGAFAEVVFRQKEAVQQTMFGGMMSAFNKLRSDLDSELADAQPGEKAAIRAARKVIGELYLSSLAEASARKSELRRRGVSGEIDMLRSFTTQGRADAQFIAGAKFNNQTLDTFSAMRREVKSGEAEDQNTKSGVFNELMKRHTQSMDYDPSPVADKLSRLTSVWYLATSPAYYLQNLTQPFVMSLPIMTGKHSYLKAVGALMRAYSDLGPMFRTAKLGEQFNYSAAPKDVRDAISKLVDRGRIDIGMDTDLGTFRLEGEGAVRDRWNKVDRGIRNLAQKMESVNRLSTAIAAYRMELARTGDSEAALEYADSIISQTHGDYTRINAPRAFNTATGKVALQFRKFQLIQLTLLAKLIDNSFRGEDRAAARKALTFLLGHTAVAAGAIGLPGFAAISWALGALLGDDDDPPFNLEQWLREQTGNGDVATLLTRGVPAALGVDLSNKLGMGNVLSMLPFNDLDLTSRSGLESAGFAIMGGPAGGLALRAVDGLALMRDGQYYRGLEQLVPTGVTNAMKAYRTASEGVTRRNGDELLSADDINGLQTFWQSIGLQPTSLAERQFRDNLKRTTDQAFKDRADRIRGQYLRARGDSDARSEARQDWLALQDARAKAGYSRQPLSALLRAEKSQRERERNTAGGVQFNRETRSFVEDLVTEQE